MCPQLKQIDFYQLIGNVKPLHVRCVLQVYRCCIHVFFFLSWLDLLGIVTAFLSLAFKGWRVNNMIIVFLSIYTIEHILQKECICHFINQYVGKFIILLHILRVAFMDLASKTPNNVIFVRNYPSLSHAPYGGDPLVKYFQHFDFVFASFF